jgi:hypothetical protein
VSTQREVRCLAGHTCRTPGNARRELSRRSSRHGGCCVCAAMSKHTPFILVFTALITACGVDDPKSETTSSTSQGIGDPYCWDEWGDPIFYDEFEVGIETIDDCYTWEDPGGGGGGETSCSWPTTYYGYDAGYGSDGASACQNARDNARDDSRNQCLTSAHICTAHADTTQVISVGAPYVIDSGWACQAEASTQCSYTWW